MLFLANVSFGIVAFTPVGWVFMIAVVLIECLIVSRRLSGSWWSKPVALATTVANAISGILGSLISTALNGGWWMVIWLPWVSRNEVDTSRQLNAFLTYYIVAFVLSVVVEVMVTQLILRRRSKGSQIWMGCSVANVVSYALGSAVLYSWSFNVFA